MNGRRARFHRLGLFARRRRWVVLAVRLLAFMAAGPLLGKLNGRLSQGGFEVPGSDSDRVKLAQQTRFESQFDITDLLGRALPNVSLEEGRVPEGEPARV